MEESGALCVQKRGSLSWASLPANSWDTPGKTIRKAISEFLVKSLGYYRYVVAVVVSRRVSP